MADVPFHRPLAISVAGLMLAGVGLAVTALVLAVAHRETGQALAYVPVAIGLTGVAVMVLRGTRWLIRVIIVVLAGQIVAIAGTAWELSHGIDAGKAGQLRRLGFDPTAGVVINLIYSSVGFALFCWFAARWLAARRRYTGQRTHSVGGLRNTRPRGALGEPGSSRRPGKP